MSRSIDSDSSAVSVPAALRPATLRASLALVALAALTAFALRAEAQANPLAFGATGLDVAPSGSRVGVRLEARDNVTWFKGLSRELQDRKSRNDVQFAAGLTFGF